MNRLVSAVATLALTAGMLLAGSGAQGASPVAASAHQSAPAAAQHRKITFKFDATSGGYKFTGKVSPKGGKKMAVLQIKKPAGWKKFRSKKTKANGTYAFTKLAKVGRFRVHVNKSNGFAASNSRVIKVYRG